MTDWQPIATAPTDTRILLAMRGREFAVEVGQLTIATSRRGRYWRLDASPGLLTGYPTGKGPTHWMHLPPLPQEENPNE